MDHYSWLLTGKQTYRWSFFPLLLGFLKWDRHLNLLYWLRLNCNWVEWDGSLCVISLDANDGVVIYGNLASQGAGYSGDVWVEISAGLILWSPTIFVGTYHGSQQLIQTLHWVVIVLCPLFFIKTWSLIYSTY